MKVDKEVFIHEFTKVLNEIQADRRLILEINKELSRYNVMIGTFDEYLKDKEMLHECDPDLLCLFAYAVTEVKGREYFNCFDYYNDKEIEVAKRYDGNIEEREEYPIVFENVIRSTDQDYLTVIHIKRANELLKNVLNYNYETQRAPKERRVKDGIIQEPYVNQKSVRQITQLMLNNEYRPDTVTYNILFDGSDEIEYDEENKTLTVFSGNIDILDGFHRHQGLARALEENPDLDLYLNLEIKNYTLEDARKYYAQKNTINLPDRATIKKMRNQNFSDMIVNELEKQSDLRGRVSSKSRTARSVGYITNFAILSEAIEQIFEPRNRKDVIDISEFLSKFFDYLLNLDENAFKHNVAEVSKVSWINHPYMFYGYVYLAKRFYDKGISVTNLELLLNQIDFNKGKSPFDHAFSQRGKNMIKDKIIEEFERVDIE